jgi:hypothetical protein
MQLGQLLVTDCRTAIQQFARSPENREVYAFCLWCDPEHGGYIISLNTEEAFRHSARERYPNDTLEDLQAFSGVKFNPPDFAFFDVWPESEVLQATCAHYVAYLDTLNPEGRAFERHMARFVEQGVLALGQLDDAFGLLDRTSDFIAYVSLHDADEPTQVALCRRTVSEDQFARVFPDIVEHERLQARLAQEPEDVQVRYWIAEVERRALRPLLRRKESTPDEHEALEALKTLGAAAVPTILDLIERYAEHRELTVPGSREAEECGGLTPAAWLTSLLLLALIEIRHGDATVRHRLPD